MNRKIVLPLVLCLFFTIGILGRSRCAKVTSFCGYRHQQGPSKFSLTGRTYNNKNLTYTISKYSDKLSRFDIEDIMARAFAAWSNDTDLTFTRKGQGSADIDICFETGTHQIDIPFEEAFDGPGGVLGHATYGYAHFDDSENWSNSIHSGVNLYSVAVHEIGHALGLSHSEVNGAIMYPTYDPHSVVMRLHSDDIQGIQKLYGRKTTVQMRKCVRIV